MTDALLFLHLLSAAVLFTGMIGLSARVLGVPLEWTTLRVFYGLWNGGAGGVLILGVILALDIDGYELWDAWILIAVALWAAAGGVVELALSPYRGTADPVPARSVRLHWIGVGMIVLLLADMIWKPWA